MEQWTGEKKRKLQGSGTEKYLGNGRRKCKEIGVQREVERAKIEGFRERGSERRERGGV